MSPGALEGLRVLDLSSVVMGPYSTQMLGDLGADVIAVEPLRGERNRTIGAGPHPELSGVALNLMRNKRSIALDLKSEAGREVFLELAATADVMITNLRPGPVARLGLDEAAVRAVRPDIIYCQCYGWPADGDDGEKPAYDDIIQSASAIADLFVRSGLEPALAPTLLADKVAGLTVANAVLAAVVHRMRTGEGQHIEVPMIDAIRSFVLVEHGGGAISEPPVGRAGHERILTRERRPQPTADGWINVLPYEADHYRALFAAGGRDDLLEDERFLTRAARFANSDSLYRDMASALPQRTTDEWLAFCEEHGIPAARAATLDELVADQPLADHPVAGTYRALRPGARFGATPAYVRRPAPLIGEHGRELLAELGWDDAQIDALAAAGVLGTRSLQD